MHAFSPLCAEWHQQVKDFFTKLHGHQSKALALFVWGAIKAQSIVLARVAEELLPESEAKVPSIERRLQRFVSNKRIDVEAVWDDFLGEIGAYWKQKEVVLVLDLTPFEEHAQVVYVGLLQQTRVLPLAWKVMPGQEQWDEGLWQIVGELFNRVKRALGEADCTLIADRGLSGLPLIQLCQAQGWHYVLRIKQEEQCRPWRLASLAAGVPAGAPHWQVLVWPGAPVAGTRPGTPAQRDLENRAGGSLAPDFRSACWAGACARVSLAHAGGVHLSRYEKSRLAVGTEPCARPGAPQPYAAGALPGVLVADAAGGLLYSQWAAGAL